MSLPIQRPDVIEYLKQVSGKYVETQTAATMAIELHWRNGAFSPEVSVQVRLPRWKPNDKWGIDNKSY